LSNSIKFLSLVLLSIMFTFCDGKSDQELYDSALDLLTEKKYDEALGVLENLVSENKNSDLAPKAMFECAKLYQGQVLTSLGSNESLLKSVEVYRDIYNTYPTYEEAGNSLFMAGFILANNLQDLKEAKTTYELYLEKFPEGQLADDARVELENLGKSPEEILMEKLQTEPINENAI